MSKTLTISLSDEQYAALQAAAAEAHQTPEELVAATVADRFVVNGARKGVARPPQDPLIQFMRELGHLVDPKTMPPPPAVPGMPPYGTPEWDRWVEEFDKDMEDEVDWTRVNLADFVER